MNVAAWASVPERQPESDKDNRGRKLGDNCRLARLPFPPPSPVITSDDSSLLPLFLRSSSNTIIQQRLPERFL